MPTSRSDPPCVERHAKSWKTWGRSACLIAFAAAALLSAGARSEDAPTPAADALREVLNGGLNAYNRGDYPTALRLFTEAAQQPLEADGAQAASILGDMYENGRGVPRSDARALEWYALAAKSGAKIANFNVGVLADRVHDYATAMAGYRVAADKGMVRAELMIGEHYRLGHGVDADPAKAVEWFRKAADHHDVIGEFWLGYAYGVGMGGLPKDPTQASQWYRLAAETGYAPAQENLAELYAAGDGVKRDFVEAAHWFSLAAEQEIPGAMNGYGYSLDSGNGVPEDVTAAIGWFQRAAAFGQPNAMHSLAAHYMQGNGVKTSFEQAYYWALLADRFYQPGAKRDAVHAIAESLRDHIMDSHRAAIEERAASFKPKTPPAPDLPLAENAATYSTVRQRLRDDAKFRLYSVVFETAFGRDGELLSLRVAAVNEPEKGADVSAEIRVPSGYIDAVRERLSTKPPAAVETGKAASYFIYFLFSPTYPDTVITDLDAAPDHQP